jgi:7,8-dihydropterin-6-yl-methyl-4-(beta-D-ribofuranosyl)aminobenzene 5'-phosphate synthase
MLVENNTKSSNLQNEHGLSYLIQKEEKNILFDTGQSDKFINNAKKLGINLESVTDVLISHSHYDHGKGFRPFINNINNKPNLYISKYFFHEKYSLVESEYMYKGVGFDKEFLEENNIPSNYIEEDIYYITKDVFIATNFSRTNSFETVNSKFYIKDNNYYIKDDFIDEIVLGINTSKGLVIIVGCSHPGIINILETISNRTGKEIFMVLGGIHLVNSPQDRINKTIDYLKKLNIKYLGLSHCTGEKACNEINNNVNGYFRSCTGTIIQIDEMCNVKII